MKKTNTKKHQKFAKPKDPKPGLQLTTDEFLAFLAHDSSGIANVADHDLSSAERPRTRPTQQFAECRLGLSFTKGFQRDYHWQTKKNQRTCTCWDPKKMAGKAAQDRKQDGKVG